MKPRRVEKQIALDAPLRADVEAGDAPGLVEHDGLHVPMQMPHAGGGREFAQVLGERAGVEMVGVAPQLPDGALGAERPCRLALLA